LILDGESSSFGSFYGYVSFSFIVVIKSIIEIRHLAAAHFKSKYVEMREVF